MTKSKTQEQLDRETDRRLRKKYGITLAEYKVLFREGKGGCHICHKPPGTRRLHVDHDHGWKKVKIESTNYPDCWQAVAVYNGTEFYATEKTKSAALKEVRSRLKRASVRGLLCYTHNAGLQKFQDDPKTLRSAADYLEKHQGAK
jgi:hypothetical protein